MPRTSGSSSGGGLFWLGVVLLIATGWIWPGILLLIALSNVLKQAGRGCRPVAWQPLIFWFGLFVLITTDWFWPGLLLWLGLLALTEPHGARRGR